MFRAECPQRALPIRHVRRHSFYSGRVPTVSIVVPAYNPGGLLTRALDSIVDAVVRRLGVRRGG